MNKIYKILFFIFLTINCISVLYAGGSKTVFKGTVIDAQSNETIPFAGIILLNSNAKTVTDVDGNFSFSTDATNLKIKVSSVGYQTEIIQISSNKANSITIKLKPDTKLLEEVVIKSGKRKYRNKNNPAVELIEKVIAHKPQNRKEGLDFYENEKYEKIQFALSNITSEFKQKKVFKKFQFVFENTDTTKLQGKEVLPIYLRENISDCYYRKSPKSQKEIVKASKMVSFDGYVDNQGMGEYLKYMYQDINIYDNNITFLTNQFLSPVAPSAPIFYKYFIMDTSLVDAQKCVRLFFSPRNKTDMLFQGYLYVLLDSTYAIKQVDMSVNKDINLNWVKEVKIAQQFDKIDDQGYMLSNDEISMDFGISKNGMGVFGQRTVSYKNYKLNIARGDSLFKGEEIVSSDSAYKRTNNYWITHRHQQLSKTESGTYAIMDSVKNVPAFRKTMNIMSLVLFGYKDFGYFEIGPVNTFYSYNPIEGIRYRFGGRTTPKLSKKINFETYIAYGFDDKKYKYYIGSTLSLTPKTIYEYPVKSLKVSYQDETKIPGQDLQFIQEDNILLSIKRGINDKLFYNKTLRFEHLNELNNHFSYTIGYQFTKETPAGNLFFNFSDYSAHQNNVSALNISEISLSLRYAPHEQFYQSKIYRIPIANRYPIFELQYMAGAKFIKNDYNYQKLRFSIYKRFYFSVLGYTDVVWESGKVFGRVPYPLLAIHRANQTYSYQILSYNMMNFLEFVSDQYTSLNIDHCFNGFFINKIPLIKRLKFREVFTCKILYGSISDQNNPAKNSNLFKFPVEYNGNPITYTIEKEPYIEASVGISNILKFFRVDVVKRLTYLNHPNVTDLGIRMRFKFDF